MTSRTTRIRIVAVLGIVAAWLIGAVVVRLGLDWADTFPYSTASEMRYLAVAAVALVIAIGGSVASVLVSRQAGAARKRQP
ncbi:hypothetical protein [Leifsonia kafniensis]